MAVKRTIYQRKVDVNVLNAVKSLLADISRVSPSSEQRVYIHTTQLQHMLCNVFGDLVHVCGASADGTHQELLLSAHA